MSIPVFAVPAWIAALALAPVFAFAAANLPPQTSNQNGVTVKVTPRSLAGPAWEFEVVFDTHSQELKDDPVKSAALVVDGGAPSAPTGWEGDGPGSHHRKGVLRFASVGTKGDSLQLHIDEVGGVATRSFVWKLK